MFVNIVPCMPTLQVRSCTLVYRLVCCLLHDQLHWLDVPERVEYKLTVMVRRCLENKAPKYLSVHCTLWLPPSAADIYDQPTSISWLYRTVGGLHLAVGLSLLQARRSGTHYQLSFTVCPSVLVTLDACLRQYYLRDISTLSAIEMRCIILRYVNFLFYSISLMASTCEC